MARWMIVLALTLSLGAHWALLQSFAWASMVATYTQETTLSDALEKTFDGEHPCKICRFVQEGQEKEKKDEAVKISEPKKNLCSSNLSVPPAPSEFTLLPPLINVPHLRGYTPPVPPPRSSLV